MISPTDKSVIKQFLQSPQYRVINSVVDELIKSWQSQSKIGSTEWETAKNVVRDEGMCEGIRTLFRELFKLAG